MFRHRNELDHLSDQDLILLHDGELSRRAAMRARKHLEACWACRCHSEHIQNTVLRFVEHCDAAIAELGTPPNHWNGFERRLVEFGKRVRQQTNDSSTHTSHFRRLAGILTPVAQVRFVTSMVLVFCLLDGLFFDQALPAARAMELLSRADQREAQSFSRLPNPVVHQRLRLTSRGRQAQWELWRSVHGADLQSSWTGDEQLKAGFLKIYSANDWDIHRPLSPTALLQWQERARATVAELHRDRDLVFIRFAPGAHTKESQAEIITDVSLTLAAGTLHTIEQSIRVASPEGDREFRLGEIAYDIVRYSETPFAAAAPRLARRTVTTPAAVSPRGWSEDELEAAEARLRFLLHQMHADLDLTPEIQRSGNSLRLRLLVDSEARRRDILAATAAIPQVTAEVWTPDNAPSSFGDYTRAVVSNPQRLHRTNGAMAAELLKCLGSWEAANQYVDRVHRSLSAAMVPALALERLADRYPDSSYLRVPVPARSLLDGVAADYLAAIQRESIKLRSNLLPVLNTCRLNDLADRPQPGDAGQTWRTGGHLYARRLRDLDAAFNLLFTTQISTRTPIPASEALRQLSELSNSLSSIAPGAMAPPPVGSRPMASSSSVGHALDQREKK
ncbi:MAG TPA: hypothetical protein VG672_17105 [Bryobacteraceae bacterium]|nr:hypothetical protein [Bryobacteraceae bacterium]